MIVDDSAVVRQFMVGLLGDVPGMTVVVAADPYIAMEKMKRKRPDVIVLDLEMPRMHGLKFLKQIMCEDPIPVVVCSGYAENGTDAAFQALEEGAVEVLAKPKIGLRRFLEETAVQLVDTIRAAAAAHLERRGQALAPRLTADAVLPPRATAAPTGPRDMVVAFGASTGGTEALRVVLEAMPADAPAMVVVQHMPEHFTDAFARRLDRLCRMQVREAWDGAVLARGLALIAPGNRHMLLKRHRTGYRVEVSDGPLVSRHRPSVDVLFRSVAQAAGSCGVGVLLTGMGDDGADGMVEMRRAGAMTIAQDEATSVVFGMPKEKPSAGERSNKSWR